MGLELAEQLGWRLPDVILYPTGGGTGLIGMWKAFQELSAIGWLADERRPRMVAVQSDGCAPIVRAFDRGERFAEPFPNPQTIASGLRVPAAVGDFMILDAVRESGGVAIAAPESDIPKWMRRACALEGIGMCPETAVCLGALEILLKQKVIKPSEQILIFNTGAAQKYPETINEPASRIDISKPIEWDSI
jgi:threonine synthase